MAISKKVTILGSGPAGLTAAIYAARAGLEPLVIEGPQRGGQLTTTTIVENFPGFPEGVDGWELTENIRKQAEKFGTEFLSELVTSVDLSKRPFSLKLSSQEILTDTLIIATGASARRLGLESELKLTGHGVSACATCDGFFFRDKVVFVIGGGDAALEEAISLTKFASSVTLLHRRDSFKASKILVERAEKNPKIKFIFDSAVEDVLDADKGEVTALKVKDLKTGQVKELPADGVFVAIGHQPNTDLFKGQLALGRGGYIASADGVTTSVPGVFAAGDVSDDRYRQAITAAGSGAKAALEAQWFIEKPEGQEAA